MVVGERHVARLSDGRRSSQFLRTQRRLTFPPSRTSQPDRWRRHYTRSRDRPATHLAAQNVRLRRRLHAQRLSRKCRLPLVFTRATLF